MGVLDVTELFHDGGRYHINGIRHERVKRNKVRGIVSFKEAS